jgi:hypothetical protein
MDIKRLLDVATADGDGSPAVVIVNVNTQSLAAHAEDISIDALLLRANSNGAAMGSLFGLWGAWRCEGVGWAWMLPTCSLVLKMAVVYVERR